MRTCTVGVFVVGALLSVGVACGDDDGGPSDTLDIEKPTLPGPTGPTIQVRNYAFDPALVTITVGETVTWAWGSALIGPHNVLPDDDVTPGQSGDPENGPKTCSFTFNQIGSFRYYCQAHGGLNGVGMSGHVIVQAEP